MSFAPVATNISLKLLGMLPGKLLRRYWTEERLAQKVKIDVRGRGDGLVFDLGRPQSVRVWLKATNFAPFPVTIDRIRLELWAGSRLGEVWCLDRKPIAPTHEAELMVLGLQGVDLGERLASTNDHLVCRLHIDAYLVCKVRDFVKRQPNMEGVRGRLSNRPSITAQGLP